MDDFQQRFRQCVKLFTEARDGTGAPLSLRAFAADAAGQRSQHVFQDADRPADLRSVSKVVTGLVLGELLTRGTQVGGAPLALETPVVPLLRQHMAQPAADQWRDVRVADLLGNTIGHERGFLFRRELGDRPESEYLAHIFEAPLPHPSAAHFAYSNVGPFLFSVIVQDWLGRSLHELARAALLDPLGIESQWRRFGDYSAGCTGLSMSNADLIKIAALLRDGGMHEARRLVANSWIREMSRPRTRTPGLHDPASVLPRYAYGLGLWICGDGSCYCDGTNGQHLVVIPRQGAALSCTAEQPDMGPIPRCLLPFTAG
jgi:CubicO group peptidase (beta-lactamase class C family)